VLELAQGTGLLANSLAMLGSSEEHTALARVLAQLAQVEEQCDSVHVDQSDADFFVFAQLVHEYIGLVHAVKVFYNVVSPLSCLNCFQQAMCLFCAVFLLLHIVSIMVFVLPLLKVTPTLRRI